MVYLGIGCKKGSSCSAILSPAFFTAIVTFSTGRPAYSLMGLPEAECIAQRIGGNLHSFIHPFSHSFSKYLQLAVAVLPFTSMLDFLPELPARSLPRVSLLSLVALISSPQQLSVLFVLRGYWSHIPCLLTSELVLSICACWLSFWPRAFAFKLRLNHSSPLKLLSSLFLSFRSRFLSHSVWQWTNLINNSELNGKSHRILFIQTLYSEDMPEAGHGSNFYGSQWWMRWMQYLSP